MVLIWKRNLSPVLLLDFSWGLRVSRPSDAAGPSFSWTVPVSFWQHGATSMFYQPDLLIEGITANKPVKASLWEVEMMSGWCEWGSDHQHPSQREKWLLSQDDPQDGKGCLGTPVGVSVILGDTALHLDAFYPTVKSLVGLLWWLSSKESTCQTVDPGSIPWVGKIPWKGKWQPISLFLPGNPVDRRALPATVHRVLKSWRRLSNWACTYESLRWLHV